MFSLERLDVDGLGPLVAGLGIKGDLGALNQRLEALSRDGAVMDEEVFSAVVRGDKAKALVVVEPLDGSGWHGFTSESCAAYAEVAGKRRLRAGTASRPSRPGLITADGSRLAAPGTGQITRAARTWPLDPTRGHGPSLEKRFYLSISCYRDRYLPGRAWWYWRHLVASWLCGQDFSPEP